MLAQCEQSRDEGMMKREEKFTLSEVEGIHALSTFFYFIA